MSKASDSVYAGNWYWECEILETLPTTTPTADSHNEDYIGAAVEDQPHFRVGWATKQGNIQAPVGYDKHSFGYRDVRGSKIHKSERVDHYGEAYGPGDIIGCMICLPVLPEHMQETSLNGSSNPLLQGGVFPHPFLNREDSYNSASGSVATSASGGVGCVGGAVGGGGSSYSNGSNGNGTTTTLDTTTTKDTANNNYNNNNDNNNNSNDNRNNNSSSSNGGNAAGEIEGGIEDEILRKELEALGNHVRFFKNGKDQGPAYTQIVGGKEGTSGRKEEGEEGREEGRWWVMEGADGSRFAIWQFRCITMFTFIFGISHVPRLFISLSFSYTHTHVLIHILLNHFHSVPPRSALLPCCLHFPHRKGAW